MKLLKKKLLSIFFSSIFIITAYADGNGVKINTSEIINEKTFPETLDVLISTPSKNDEIVIPMSKKEYEIQIVDELQKGWSKQKDKLKKSLIDVKQVNDIMLVKFNTKVEETYISVYDDSTKLNFAYSFANGYVLRTYIYKYIDDNEYEDGTVDFLYEKFEEYLIKKGFSKDESIKSKINDILFQTKKYILDNYIVIIGKEYNFVGYNFLVTMENKEIDSNIYKIREDIRKANLEYRYESLNKILK